MSTGMRHSILPGLLSTLFLFFSPSLYAQGFGLNTGGKLPEVRNSVLPTEEAFALSTFIEAPGTVVLLWEIKDGYYLYRNSLAATEAGAMIALGELPAAITIEDEFFGNVEVYFDRLLHRFPLSALNVQNHSVTFELQYQGCAKDLYCYPMQHQTVTLSLPQ